MVNDVNYAGLSDGRALHMLGVARKAYRIAKKLGYDEAFARKMFLLGLVHDIGYEFTPDKAEHSKVSVDILDSIGTIFPECRKAVLFHGNYLSVKSAESRILNTANMLVSSDGDDIPVALRLTRKREKYGEHSDEYLVSCDICFRLGLIPYNPAAHIRED